MKWYLPAAGMLIAALGYGLYRATRTGQSRVYVSRGALHGPGGAEIRLTTTDKLWLARAIVGETGGTGGTPDAAVAWALAQNLMLIQGAGRERPRFQTFTALIRAYAQPVNPQWAVPGAGKCLQNPGACTPERIARRARVSSMSWGDIPEGTRSIVERFFAGDLANPVPGMTDWAAFTFEGAQVNIGGNWFGVRAGRNVV